MYIGVGIFLIVVGAILEFAIGTNVSGVNLKAIGWICMGGGVLAILLSFVTGARRGTAGGYSARRVTHEDPATGTRIDEVQVDPDNR